jgi:hypothetical protein
MAMNAVELIASPTLLLFDSEDGWIEVVPGDYRQILVGYEDPDRRRSIRAE